MSKLGFGWLLFINLLVSFGLTFFFWKLFSMNKDAISQFGILSSFFTVIGYILTIYQISLVKDRQTTEIETVRRVKKEVFQQEAYQNMCEARTKLDEMIRRFDATREFSDEIVDNFVGKLHEIDVILVRVDKMQNKIEEKNVCNCEECKALLSDCIKEMQNDPIMTFKKTTHLSRVRVIASKVNELEVQIKI